MILVLTSVVCVVLWCIVLDQYLVKYGASITGYGLLALPVFFPREKARLSMRQLGMIAVRLRPALHLW